MFIEAGEIQFPAPGVNNSPVNQNKNTESDSNVFFFFPLS